MCETYCYKNMAPHPLSRSTKTQDALWWRYFPDILTLYTWMGTLVYRECIWGGGWKVGRHIFITFIKRIQFCILNWNEKENSRQLYQTRACPISVVFSLFWYKKYFPQGKVTKCHSHCLNMVFIYQFFWGWGKQDWIISPYLQARSINFYFYYDSNIWLPEYVIEIWIL